MIVWPAKTSWMFFQYRLVKSLLLVATLCVSSTFAFANIHSVLFFPGLSDGSGPTGLLRIVNHSDEDGEVKIIAIDDSGDRSEEVTVAVMANTVTAISSEALENGDTELGIEGIGDGEGHWRLLVSSDLDIQPYAYIKDSAGAITPIQIAASKLNGRYEIGFPAREDPSDMRYVRIINRSTSSDVVVVVEGRGDDPADVGEASVLVQLGHGEAKQYSVVDLEEGEGVLQGSLGSGVLNWTLTVSADGPIDVLGYVQKSSREIINLSASPRTKSEPVDLTIEDFTHIYVGNARFESNIDWIRLNEDGTFEGEREPLPLAGTYSITGLRGNLITVDLTYGSIDDCVFSFAFDGYFRGEGISVCDLVGVVNHEGVSISLDDEYRVFDRVIEHLADLTVTEQDVAFGSDSDATNCVAISDVENQGSNYSLVSSRWQSQDNADSPWIGVSGTLNTTEICALEEMGSGNFRVVLNIRENGANKYYISNILQNQSAAAFFESRISSPIVQSKCINCHVSGGASGHTRIRFVNTQDSAHLTKNLGQFRDFLNSQTDGKNYILDKIRGMRSHGGGTQVAHGSAQFADMQEFLTLLESEQESEPAFAGL